MNIIVTAVAIVVCMSLGLFNFYYMWQIGNLLQFSGFAAPELPIYVGKMIHNMIFIIASGFILSVCNALEK